MNHFQYRPTPVHKLSNLSDELGINLYIKREDLFVEAGGGSKARMLQYILYKAKNLECNYILTAGEPCSNFNRALALMCGKLNLKLRLVVYNRHPELSIDSLNRRVCDFCNVEYISTTTEKVAEALVFEKQKLVKEGHKPYFIWGGGKSQEGIFSYTDCIKEISTQIDFIPDYIFTALGTGTTLTGLVVGCRKYYPGTKVIGISIARPQNKAWAEVNLMLKEFDKSPLTVSDCEINDNFLMGGYGCSNKELNDFLEYSIKQEGIIFDKIYVGKALYGLYQLVKYNLAFRNKNIIFMNTGGIYNF